MKILMDEQRRILRIETEDFSVRFNGLSNNAYKEMLTPLGIELRFEKSVDEVAPPAATYDA